MAYNACIHSKGKDEFKASYISSGISSSLSKLPSTLSDPNAVATCFSLYSLPLMVTVVSHPSEVTSITILLITILLLVKTDCHVSIEPYISETIRGILCIITYLNSHVIAFHP